MVTLIQENGKKNVVVKLDEGLELHAILEYQNALIKTIRATALSEHFGDLQDEICILMELLKQLLPTERQMQVLNDFLYNRKVSLESIEDPESELN